MLGEEFTGKSCYANFFKLKNNVMLSEFHVNRIHVRRGLPVHTQSRDVTKKSKKRSRKVIDRYYVYTHRQTLAGWLPRRTSTYTA